MGIGGGRNRIQVILEAVTNRFDRGLQQARRMMDRFGEAVRAGATVGGVAIAGLIAGVWGLERALRGVVGAAQTFFDIFLKGAVAAEKLEVTLTALTGSQEMAARVMAIMDERATQLGVSFEDMSQAATAAAFAAKDASGAFDINRWERILNLMQTFAALRPDVPFQFISRAVMSAVQGDFSTFERVVVESFGVLSEDLRKKLETLRDSLKETDETLRGGFGAVEVRVGQMGREAADGLALLEDVARELTHGQDVIKDYADTTEAQWNRIIESLKSAARAFGIEFLPFVKEALTWLTDWLSEHKDEVNAFFANLGTFSGDKFLDFLTSIRDAIEQIDWEKLRQGVEDIDWKQVANDIKEVADALSSLVRDVRAAIDEFNEFARSPAGQFLFGGGGRPGLLSPETARYGAAPELQARIRGALGIPEEGLFAQARGVEPQEIIIRVDEDSLRLAVEKAMARDNIRQAQLHDERSQGSRGGPLMGGR